MSTRDYVERNRQHWTDNNAAYTDRAAEGAWSAPEIKWGVWGVPEAEVRALPPLGNLDVIELGCGTAYFSSWIKRAGARRVVGVDVTPAQLATARAMDLRFGAGLELVEGNAEELPFADSSFDLAISEYGASIWCDPKLWIPEAARVLRSGGELVFLRNSTISILCAPDEEIPNTEFLQRPQRHLNRIDWPDGQSTEFQMGHGDWVRQLRSSGFEILDLIELYAPDDARAHSFYNLVPVEWAKRWPAEEIWRARRI
ncbi:MAG: class I SAM-dependent methyltransferase [Candidatus Dormibacteria bacterium]